jgi:CPA1 family monovalent cation:H+ antiporter
LPLVALGGAVIGGLVGLGVDWILRRIDDQPVQITISLLAPFLAYLAAERLDCSGALAVVTAGVFIGWRLPRMVTARTRLELTSFWRMLVYLLNGVIFVFIGLQLPQVVDGLEHKSWATLLFESGRGQCRGGRRPSPVDLSFGISAEVSLREDPRPRSLSLTGGI